MLTGFIELLIFLGTIALLVPALVLFLECIFALLPSFERAPVRAGAGGPGASSSVTTVVLVPAHDEEEGIRETLASLKAGMGPGQRILVVADNCSDRTAEAARAEGVEVVERKNPDERGKGFALAFGLDHLAPSPPDVVIIVDADCRVEPGSLPRLASQAVELNRPVQGEYLLIPPEPAQVSSPESPEDHPSPNALISAFAILLKNRVRPLGLKNLGLPVQLTGSGMAFPWAVLRKAPPTGAYLVEDMLMGIELARSGHPPAFYPDVKLTSPLPSKDEAGQKQRRRWEHGHLQTLMTLGFPLIRDGILRRKIDLAAMGLDLIVPPLAFFVLLLGTAWLTTGILALFGLWGAPFGVATLALLFVAAAVFLGWAGFGRGLLPAEQLKTIPGYIRWKLPLYLSFLQQGSHAEWERTARDKGERGEPGGTEKDEPNEASSPGDPRGPEAGGSASKEDPKDPTSR